MAPPSVHTQQDDQPRVSGVWGYIQQGDRLQSAHAADTFAARYGTSLILVRIKYMV